MIFTSYPGTALQAADDFWRVISSRGELYEQAVRTARASKAKGNSIDVAVDDAMMTVVVFDEDGNVQSLENEGRHFVSRRRSLTRSVHLHKNHS